MPENPPMAPLTGTDVADLHQTCDRHGICWTTIDKLTVPYVIDIWERTIYVCGRLPLQRYYEVITEAVYRLIHGIVEPNVIPLRVDLAQTSIG